MKVPSKSSLPPAASSEGTVEKLRGLENAALQRNKNRSERLATPVEAPPVKVTLGVPSDAPTQAYRPPVSRDPKESSSASGNDSGVKLAVEPDASAKSQGPERAERPDSGRASLAVERYRQVNRNPQPREEAAKSKDPGGDGSGNLTVGDDSHLVINGKGSGGSGNLTVGDDSHVVINGKGSGGSGSLTVGDDSHLVINGSGDGGSGSLTVGDDSHLVINGKGGRGFANLSVGDDSNEVSAAAAKARSETSEAASSTRLKREKLDKDAEPNGVKFTPEHRWKVLLKLLENDSKDESSNSGGVKSLAGKIHSA